MGRRGKKKATSSGSASSSSNTGQNDSPSAKPKVGNAKTAQDIQNNSSKASTTDNRSKIAGEPKTGQGMSAKPSDHEKKVLADIPDEFRNPEAPITLKDLVGAITKSAVDRKKVAADRKKVAGSTKEDQDLKEELSTILRQIKMDNSMENSALASDKPLSNEEGLREIKKLLSAGKSEALRRSRTENLDTSPTAITESLLDFTKKAGQSSTDDSENAKDDNGPCAVCATNATTKCTGCRKVFYCSRDCQRNHWNTHKDLCRPYKVSVFIGLLKLRDTTPKYLEKN